jgi:hypothetical protein
MNSMAIALNDSGTNTSTGKKWTSMQIFRVLERLSTAP